MTTQTEIQPCGRGCARDTVIKTTAGMAAENKWIVMCCCCQASTPMLPLEQAIERWNKDFGRKVA